MIAKTAAVFLLALFVLPGCSSSDGGAPTSDAASDGAKPPPTQICGSPGQCCVLEGDATCKVGEATYTCPAHYDADAGGLVPPVGITECHQAFAGSGHWCCKY